MLRELAETLELSAAERAFLDLRLAAAGPRTISRQADESLLAGRYHEAASAYHRAAALAPHESRLVWKARLMAVAPWATGPVLRARQRRIEHGLAIDERHVR